MKKITNIFKIILLIAIFIYIFQNSIYAKIDTCGVEIGSTFHISSSNETISRVVGILQILGSVVSILALVIIGIRYMISSIEEKAEMKNVLIYYVIGAVLVFGTSNILGIAYKIISNITFK